MEKDFNIDRDSIPLELFKHLGDGNNVSPREVLKVKLALNKI